MGNNGIGTGSRHSHRRRRNSFSKSQLRELLRSGAPEKVWPQLLLFFHELRFRKEYFPTVFYPVFDDIVATLFGYARDVPAWLAVLDRRERENANGYGYAIRQLIGSSSSFFDAVFRSSSLPPLHYSVPVAKLPVPIDCHSFEEAG